MFDSFSSPTVALVHDRGGDAAAAILREAARRPGAEEAPFGGVDVHYNGADIRLVAGDPADPDSPVSPDVLVFAVPSGTITKAFLDPLFARADAAHVAGIPCILAVQRTADDGGDGRGEYLANVFARFVPSSRPRVVDVVDGSAAGLRGLLGEIALSTWAYITA